MSIAFPSTRAARQNTTRRGRRRLGVATKSLQTPPVFWTILAVVGILCAIGLIFVLSASAVRANHKLDSSWYWFTKQSFFLAGGAVLLLIGLRVDYHFWARHAGVWLAGAVILLVTVVLPTPLSHEVNGSKRWLGPEFGAFQPSEIAKLALIIWLARMLSQRQADIRDPLATTVPALAVLGTLGALVMLEPDLGTTLLLVAITFIMLGVAGGRLDSLAAMTMPFAAVGVFFSMQGYRRERMLAFLDPWKEATGSGWQTLQSRVGIASGGVFGVGLGNGRSKWGFLPEAHTDFIYAVIGEELGLLGCVAVLGLFVSFLVAGVSAGRRARDVEGTLIAIGISSWIGLQALFNIAVAIGVLPNKGITLPFVSYGGSSLMVTMFAAGILANIARQPASRPARTSRTSRSGSGDDSSSTIDLRSPRPSARGARRGRRTLPVRS